MTLAQYEQEILACDAIIKTLPGDTKWFRGDYEMAELDKLAPVPAH